MPVRGTTHAIHTKRIIIREGEQEGTRIVCAWLDCGKDATILHEARVFDQFKPGFGPPSRYCFCSERHKQYWLNHRDHGNLPAGYRDTIL